jgi:hypothetical protein
MVCPKNHDSHEAEGLELGELFRIGGCDRELDAVGQVLGRGSPADLGEFMGVGGNHTFDRLNGSALACHRDLKAVISGRSLAAARNITSSMSIRCSRNVAMFTLDQSVAGSASSICTTSWMVPKAACPGIVG